MDLWAFGTSSHGLGLSAKRLWSLTIREHAALCKVANERTFSADMFFQLRADIHNTWMQRKDGRPWTAEDFGGKAAQEWNPKSTMTPEELKRRTINMFGPNGRGKKGAVLEMPALKAMRGTGQPIPVKVG